MKIKNILGIMVAVSAVVLVLSCTDDNDWSTDASHNRLFGVKSSSLSVETFDNSPTQATVTFDAYDKNTEYYIIEISTDSLYDEIPMGGENAKVFGEDKSIKKSPVMLSELSEYTDYYMRVKGMSGTTPDSRWVYYKSGMPFKTPGILNDILEADRLDESIRLTWIAGSRATHIVMTVTIDDEPVVTTVQLTDTDLQAAEYTFTGLKPNKTYKFEIYNGERQLGAKTVKTAKGLPDADLMINLDKDIDVVDQILMSDLATQALDKTGTGSATISIGLPAGTDIILGSATEGLDIPEGVSVTFFGRPGDRTNLKVNKSMSVAGTHGFVSFEHVNIDCGYDADAGTNGAQYLINESGACMIDSITFTECNVAGIQNAAVRLSASSGQTVGKLKIDNCIFTNHAGAYALFCFDKGITMDKIEVKNSTFYNICLGKKSFIDVSLCKKSMDVDIEACTFYNLLGDGAYFLNAKNGGDVNLNMYRVILAKTVNPAARGKQGSINVVASGTYQLNDFVLGKNLLGIDMFDGASNNVFKKPAAGDFTIKNTLLQMEKVGDPRWLGE